MNEKLICPICNQEIVPGDRRISWFNKDDGGFATEHGAIHLSHLIPSGE